MKRRLLSLVVAAASLLGGAAPCFASTGRIATPDPGLEEWLRKGQAFNETLGRPDSALYYFSLVEGRYHEGMSKPDKEVCARALLGKWVVLFSTYFDYPHAFEALLSAERIASEAGLRMPRIDVCLAGMYQTVADESNDTSLFSKAMSHYAKAVETAVSTRDSVTADLAFTNAVQLASSERVASDLSPLWKSYSSLPEGDAPRVRRRFNTAFYQALTAFRRGDAGEADRIMGEALAAVPDRQEFRRMKAIGHIFRGRAVLESGSNARARDILDEALGYATKHHMRMRG